MLNDILTFVRILEMLCLKYCILLVIIFSKNQMSWINDSILQNIVPKKILNHYIQNERIDILVTLQSCHDF